MKPFPFLVAVALVIWAAFNKDWFQLAGAATLILLVGLDAIATAIKERA